MPGQPLCGISGNSNYKDGIAGRFELTSYWRSHIVGCASGGQWIKALADDLGMHPAIMGDILMNGSINIIPSLGLLLVMRR